MTSTDASVVLPGRESRLPSTFRALRHRNYRLWFFGQGESLIGTRMQTMAQQVLITATIPPRLAVAEGVRQLKGASSHYVNHQSGGEQRFTWQDGYGVLTLGERSMPDVVKYVKNQRQHYDSGTIMPTYERINDNDP